MNEEEEAVEGLDLVLGHDKALLNQLARRALLVGDCVAASDGEQLQDLSLAHRPTQFWVLEQFVQVVHI